MTLFNDINKNIFLNINVKEFFLEHFIVLTPSII